jgi:predicted nucleotidyltransferase
LASLKLRDRDAVATEEGLIFRIYGYAHPPKAYICDVEYAPASIYKSEDPRAIRQKGKQTYYKFYLDQGLQFVRDNYPQYTVWHEPLQTSLVGVHQTQITEIRKPDEAMLTLLKKRSRDSLHQALKTASSIILERSGLDALDFGVFGSFLHGFYHPQFSDLDFIAYGKKELSRLRETLHTLYDEHSSLYRNEFETENSVKDKAKRWRFINYSPREYWWHQKRKAIYATFQKEKNGRRVKAEFEPVKKWSEIHNEYDSKARIFRKGWIKAEARITSDSEAPFLPSVYEIEITKNLNGTKADDVERILSYVEEFRMQAEKDETVYVEGNLEQVVTHEREFNQITLTYGPRYFEQVLKAVKPSLQ